MKTPRFHFAGMGIGKLLSQSRLVVPPNQRSYAWGENHVRDLLQDLSAAILQDVHDDYFLGTVVLVDTGEGHPQIADGQQRIATTTILLARARDILKTIGRAPSAQAIDNEFLRQIDMRTEEKVSRVRLNDEDDEFFRSYILEDMLSESVRTAARSFAKKPSNRRLLDASDLIADFIRGEVSNQRVDEQANTLLSWVEFIKDNASVVAVTVPDEVGAFRMFETLNDRGLKASQADILKNFLFSKVTARDIHQVQGIWSEMTGVISTLPDDDDDNLVNYIRYFWITKNGLTRQRELAESIKRTVSGQRAAMQFMSEASAASKDYVALWQPNQAKWTAYKASTRKHLITLVAHLKAEQIIPLLFAIAIHFTPEEADKAFKLCVTWSVRFLIAGQGKAGRLDKPYSEHAHDIGMKRITTARALRDSMAPLVPSNREFQDAFATARVSKAYLARYYLRAMDQELKHDPTPEYVANEEADQVNLEHVVPLSGGAGWDMDGETLEAVQKLLGNMVLLKADKNNLIGNAPFTEKKPVYSESSYFMTAEVGRLDQFGIDEIKARQQKMGEIAVRTWTTDFL